MTLLLRVRLMTSDGWFGPDMSRNRHRRKSEHRGWVFFHRAWPDDERELVPRLHVTVESREELAIGAAVGVARQYGAHVSGYFPLHSTATD